MVEVTIKERGIISPELAKKFFGERGEAIRAGLIEQQRVSFLRPEERAKIRLKEPVSFLRPKELKKIAPPAPPTPPPKPPTIRPPTMPTDIRVTAIGARFPGGFEPLAPELETRFEREERKIARQQELARLFEEKFREPLREKLAPIRRPPIIEKIREPLAIAVGEPLSLAIGPPELREETVKFLKEFPEEVFKAGVGVTAIAVIPPLILPLAAAPAIKKFREEKFEEAIGIAVAQTALIGTALIGAKAITRIPRPVGKPLKGVVRPRPPKLKLKKKITITEKKLLAQLAKRAREPTQPPRITNVVRKDGEITIVVKSAGKVVERRRLLEGITPKGVIEAQLRAAKAQGAKFSGIKPPTVLPEAALIQPLAISRFPPLEAPRIQLRLQRQLSAQLRALGVVTALDLSRQEKQRQKELQKQLQLSGISQAQAQAQKQEQLNLQAQTQLQAQGQKQAQKQLESQMQAQFQAQAQAQSQAQAETTETILGPEIARPRVPRKKPSRKPRIPIPLPIPMIPEAETRARPPVRVRRKGYDAFAKVRGKPKKIADNVSRISALSLGSEFVDQTPAASFTIKPTGRVASGRDIFDWESRKFKFRLPIRRGKPVKSEIIIEKNRFRIDTAGEVAGIPLEAKRLKEAGLSPRKIRKTMTGEIDLRKML